MKLFRLFALVLSCCLLAFAGEILENGDLSRMLGGVPAGWSFRGKAKGSIVQEEGGNCAKLVSELLDDSSTISANGKCSFPAGSHLRLSGEYRTENIEMGKGGNLFVSSRYRSVVNNDKQPVAWLNANLKPSDTWKSFSVEMRAPYKIASFSVNGCIHHAKGTILFRKLSLDISSSTPKFTPGCEVIWREMEDICFDKFPSNWGQDTAEDFSSGKGAIGTENQKLDWNFQIAEVTDERTLFSKERTWHLWTRVYGYMESPRLFIYYQDKYLRHIDTPANEKVKDGKYAGPGHFTWVYCGNFKTKGGAQKLSFQPKGRTFIDCVLLTDDAQYAPVKFEAKDFPQAKAIDVRNANMLKAEYAYEGLTDRISLPLSFRIAGKNMIIPNDKAPGVMHISLPEEVVLDGMTSHWAGETWNAKARWGNKFLTWKRTGERSIGGKKYIDYEAYLYFLSSNQYLVFAHIKPEAFKAGRKFTCEFWLENNGEKQLPEKMDVEHIAIEPVRPFKKIWVGPSYVPLKMMYFPFEKRCKDLKACGFNYLGSWAGFVDKPMPEFDEFRNAAYKEGFLMSAVVEQYSHCRPEHSAYGIDGKPYKAAGGQGVGGIVVSLALDKDDPPIGETMERARIAAKHGITIEFDDEMTNVMEDKIDYSPKVKALFREYLAKKDLAYVEPEAIVKEKKNKPDMYKVWVDFKCERMAYWYSLYRQAFEEGLKEAKGKYPENMKPMMMTCIQGAGKDFKTAEDIKVKGFFDYKLLSKYCDVIEIMSYTYGGVPEAAKPGDAMEMYGEYLGKDIIAPILLAGGYGTETSPEKKVMLKYEMFESLMQKPKMIVFYAGATVFNAPTLAPVVDAMRIALPYEDFFTEGERYRDFKGSASFLRLKGLRLGKRVLLYAANYADDAKKIVTVNFPAGIKSALECDGQKKLPVNGDSISFDFQKDRGRLFLLELK